MPFPCRNLGDLGGRSFQIVLSALLPKTQWKMLFPKSVSYSCYHFPMDYNTWSVVEPLSKTEFEGHIAKQASNISEQRFSTWFPSPKTLQKAKYRCPLGNRSNSTKMQEPLNQLPDLVWYFSVFLTYFFPLKKKRHPSQLIQAPNMGDVSPGFPQEC